MVRKIIVVGIQYYEDPFYKYVAPMTDDIVCGIYRIVFLEDSAEMTRGSYLCFPCSQACDGVEWAAGRMRPPEKSVLGLGTPKNTRGHDADFAGGCAASAAHGSVRS